MKGDDSANYRDEIQFSMENKLVVLEVILAIASRFFTSQIYPDVATISYFMRTCSGALIYRVDVLFAQNHMDRNPRGGQKNEKRI
jgi:hypothetical protein